MNELENISAADFLAAVGSGDIDLNDFIESEKTASPELENLSDEELYALLEEIDVMEKGASEGFDLNSLSVGEFVEYAAELEDTMIKHASAAASEAGKRTLKEMLSAFGSAAKRHAISGATLGRKEAIKKGFGAHKAMKGLPKGDPKLTDLAADRMAGMKELAKQIAETGGVGAAGATGLYGIKKAID